MKMKTFGAVIAKILFASSMLSAVACNDATPEQMADQATRELGLPVYLWAFADDVCATRQLSSLFNEYQSWNSAGRSTIAARFNSTYSSLVFVRTEDLGKVSGEVIRLQLWNANRYVVASKTLLDTRVSSLGKGVTSGMRVDKGDAAAVEGKVLRLQATRASDESVLTTYATYDSEWYNAIQKTGVGSNFEMGLSSGVVFLNTTPVPASATDSCGKLAKIKDLF